MDINDLLQLVYDDWNHDNDIMHLKDKIENLNFEILQSPECIDQISDEVTKLKDHHKQNLDDKFDYKMQLIREKRDKCEKIKEIIKKYENTVNSHAQLTETNKNKIKNYKNEASQRVNVIRSFLVLTKINLLYNSKTAKGYVNSDTGKKPFNFENSTPEEITNKMWQLLYKISDKA